MKLFVRTRYLGLLADDRPISTGRMSLCLLQFTLNQFLLVLKLVCFCSRSGEDSWQAALKKETSEGGIDAGQIITPLGGDGTSSQVASAAPAKSKKRKTNASENKEVDALHERNKSLLRKVKILREKNKRKKSKLKAMREENSQVRASLMALQRHSTTEGANSLQIGTPAASTSSTTVSMLTGVIDSMGREIDELKGRLKDCN